MPACPDPRRELMEQALEEALRHHRAGDVGSAAELYAAILALDPSHPQALHLSGTIAWQRGACDLARALVQRALAAEPRYPEALNTLGVLLSASGDARGARAAFADALSIAPDYADALHNLGTVHQSMGDAAAAIDCHRHALAVGPRTPERVAALGLALDAADRHAAARELFDEVLASDPDHLPALHGLGSALRNLGHFDAARAAFERAAHIAPRVPDAWIGLGTTALDMSEVRTAIACFDRAVELAPDDALLRWNRAIACLAAGRLAEGWRESVWRWRSPGFDSVERHFRSPRWDGITPLEGRSILVWREQGIGDELLFASMLADLARIARRAVVECEPRLLLLLRRSFPAVTFVAAGHPPHPATAAPDIDCNLPLGELAPLLRPALDRFPRDAAYLRADPARVEHWRRVLSRLGPRPKIGISWRSANLRGVRALACSELRQWDELLRGAQADWINLQYDECAEEIDRSRAANGVAIHRFPELDMFRDLDDTAALMSALDLVITAPTTVSVLAAALGVPTWQLSSGTAWQMHGGPDMPWLPAMRVFHRAWQEDWTTVLARAGTALAGWLDSRNAGGCRGLSGLDGNDAVLS